VQNSRPEQVDGHEVMACACGFPGAGNDDYTYSCGTTYATGDMTYWIGTTSAAGWLEERTREQEPKWWRWFDIFRVFIDVSPALVSAEPMVFLRRVQEKLSPIVRSRQKRRAWLQKLYGA